MEDVSLLEKYSFSNLTEPTLESFMLQTASLGHVFRHHGRTEYYAVLLNGWQGASKNVYFLAYGSACTDRPQSLITAS